VNPNFVGTSLGSQNLHLQSGSPIIGAGINMSGLIYDHDGLIRPAPPSIGAYEFSSASASQIQPPNAPTNLTVVVQ